VDPVPAHDSSHPARGIALRWGIALALFFALAGVGYGVLARWLAATEDDLAIIEVVDRQRMLIQRAAFLAHELVDAPPGAAARRRDARGELAGVLDVMEALHPEIVARVRTPAARAALLAPRVSADATTHELITQGRALLALPEAELSREPRPFQALLRIGREGDLSVGLNTVLEELRREHEELRDIARITGGVLLAANVVLGLVVLFGIATPMVRRVRREIEGRDAAYRLLEERTRELERSRAAALSMREDADLARLEAECAREAAWTLVAIVRSSGDGIIGLALDGTITSWNAAAERLYGYGLEAALGKPLAMLVPPERRDEAAAMLARIAAGDDVLRVETVRRRADGTQVQVWVTLSAVKDSGGRVVGASSIDRDVTEERQAEERFRIAVEAAPAAMLMADGEGRIVLANVQAEKLFGYARAELDGLSVDALVPARARAAHAHQRAEFVRAPAVRPMDRGRELAARRKDGAEIPVQIGLTPLVIDGETFVLSAIIDVSERKRTEDALARQAAELERSNRELEQFAYVASHDLQEPLRMVASYVQLIARRYRGRLDADADEFIGYAVEGAQRMRVLINDLLALSRVGTRPAVRTQVALADVLADVQANLGVAIAEAGATITHDPLPTIVADRGLLMHLLQNLISNAVKFRGDAPPAVHVGVALEPGRWVLSVRDNGIGIDPRHEDRIFQVFQRLHTRDRYPGTGIGLALCRKIAEVHGGTIWMRSVPGHGSTFFVALPEVPLADAPPADVRDAAAAP